MIEKYGEKVMKEFRERRTDRSAQSRSARSFPNLINCTICFFEEGVDYYTAYKCEENTINSSILR